MAKKKINYKVGDIFAMKIPNGQYVFGRILLDIPKQCVEPGLVEYDSPLERLSCLIVEGYALLSDTPEFKDSNVVVKGFSIDDSAIEDGTFKIAGHKEVDPKEVDFPEFFHIDLGYHKVSFEKGEISIPLNITMDAAAAYRLRGGFSLSETFDSVILTLINRYDLIDDQEPTKLQHGDLRFNTKERQKEIYALIGEDLARDSYYNLALKRGFDTARFFNDNK